jgi:hypothetical protein
MRKVKVIDGRNVDGSGEPSLPYYAIRQRKGKTGSINGV